MVVNEIFEQHHVVIQEYGDALILEQSSVDTTGLTCHPFSGFPGRLAKHILHRCTFLWQQMSRKFDRRARASSHGDLRERRTL